MTIIQTSLFPRRCLPHATATKAQGLANSSMMYCRSHAKIPGRFMGLGEPERQMLSRRGIITGLAALDRRSHQSSILGVGARSGSVLSWIGQERHHLIFLMTMVREYHEVGFAPTILRILAIVMNMRYPMLFLGKYHMMMSYWLPLDVEVVVCLDRCLSLMIFFNALV